MTILNIFNAVPDPRTAFLLAIAIVSGFLFAIAFHESAHAYVAYRLGDPTAKMAGRVTLNPFKHLDPIGTVMFFVIGLGWAKPVPINPRFFHKRSDELKVAFAGIVANIALAALLAIPLRIATLQHQVIETSVVLSIIKFWVEINLMLAAFNLIPIPPLDGSHLLAHFLSEENKYKYLSIGQYLLLGLILYDVVSGTSIILAIMEPILRVLSYLVMGTPIRI